MKVFLVKFVQELFTVLSFLSCYSKSEDMENYPRWDESLRLCSFFKKEKISEKKKSRLFLQNSLNKIWTAVEKDMPPAFFLKKISSRHHN